MDFKNEYWRLAGSFFAATLLLWPVLFLVIRHVLNQRSRKNAERLRHLEKQTWTDWQRKHDPDEILKRFNEPGDF